MKKVLKRSFVVFCLVASMLLVAPFHIANASTSVTISTSNILGVGVYDQSTSSQGLTMFCVLDNEYQGTVTVKVNVTGSAGSGTVTCKFAFNGSIGYGTCPVTVGWVNQTSVNSITAQSLSYKYDDISTVYSVDYTNFIGYQYWLLYNMEYTEINGVSSLYSNNFKSITGFSETSTDPFIRMTENDLYIAYFTNRNEGGADNPTVSVYVPSRSSCTVEVTKMESPTYTYYTSGDYVFNLFKFHVVKPDDSYVLNSWTDRFIIRWGQKSGQATKIVPIWYGTLAGMNDDMLRFLALDTSVESAADLQNEQSEFSQSASDLYTYENTFNESLNDSLDDINVNFDIGNTFGSKFLASASWVRQQFDALTSSSPFGSVLSFSLVLGIALLVIGKAVK